LEEAIGYSRGDYARITPLTDSGKYDDSQKEAADDFKPQEFFEKQGITQDYETHSKPAFQL
jgi:hypothetical protein